MNLRAMTRTLALIGLCIAAVWMMGSGTQCPKPCVIEGAPCAQTCGGPEDFVCRLNTQSQNLECQLQDEGDEGDPAADEDRK